MKKPILLFSGVFLLMLSCIKKKYAGFELLSANDTGIYFQNTIKENDSINVFTYMNIYTGAGVAVGDIDNDGLTDVYFSGNMKSGRLYRNKGDMKFDDITDTSGIWNDRWGTGATMVDINQDGWLDIYVCVSGGGPVEKRANLLYINNGISEKTGQVTFSERAVDFGLDDTRQSMHAAFFDYDRDNDLDMYLLVNPAAYEYQVNISVPRILDGSSISNDRLYRNDGPSETGQITYTDATLETGILSEGYGLGVGISDINNDQWPDIYVSNDFIGNDILYINQGDGTFKDELTQYIDHSSYAGMGNDIADVNNDGLADIMVLDMRPEDNLRQKLIISSTGYDRFQTMLESGYAPQYSRNTLQLNQGNKTFGEVGFLAGVSSTDWSWSALLADYNNDGYKDLYVTNGFYRDLGNLDYIHYQNVYDNPLGSRDVKIRQKRESMESLPMAALPNYLYLNNEGEGFSNTSKNWNLTNPSCSNGAAYADLDNDGDLDLVVNNIDQPAFILKNNIAATNGQNNYITVTLKGKKGNLQGIGSKLNLFAKDNMQHHEHFLSRGYESSVDHKIFFGLGPSNRIDSLRVLWPDGSRQTIKDIDVNQHLVITQEDARQKTIKPVQKKKAPWFTEITDSLTIKLHHQEDNMVDFKLQPILPHMHSRNGPGIAVADVNGDGLEDFFMGGAAGQSAVMGIQNKSGDFDSIPFPYHREHEDMGSLFFDVDGDNDLDLYIVSGGVISDESNLYQDRFYVNDGLGNYEFVEGLPKMWESGSVATAADYDHDGDLDLFVGGRVRPGEYPLSPKSYLLQNNTSSKSISFKDATDQVLGSHELGMVSGALWTDFNNDGWQDLIVVGEFMPITFFKNDQGKLTNVSQYTGLKKTAGWWNSIAGSDFDNDGDIDYILGNHGLNTKYKISREEPLSIYAKDFDNDGRIDPVMSHYIDGEKYLAHGRDEIIGQINAMRSRFKTYQSYAETTFDRSFLPSELEDAYTLKSHLFESSYLENLGNGQFRLSPLPWECQVAPVQGLAIEDFNGDGQLDVLLTGNAFGIEVASGRQDALKGIVLRGDGNGGFIPLSNSESGILSKGDASGLAILRKRDGNMTIVSAHSNGPIKFYELNDKRTFQNFSTGDIYGTIHFEDGNQQKFELYNGSGYLSQSSKSISLNQKIIRIDVTNIKGEKRTIYEAE